MSDGRMAFIAMYDYGKQTNMYAVQPAAFVLGMESVLMSLILVVAWFEARR